jgi:hypothetical protein
MRSKTSMLNDLSELQSLNTVIATAVPSAVSNGVHHDSPGDRNLSKFFLSIPQRVPGET